MKFSVLMSVYMKEKPEFLDRAFYSIYYEQELKPSQIVLVEDGRLTDGLYSVIKKWREKIPDILDIIKLKNNVGLGDALAIGIKKCKFDLVARMDSDDISLPNRFKEQVEIFKEKNIDLCGAWIVEFDNDENNIKLTKIAPELHNDIVKTAKFKNPINHPVCMFKKSSVLEAGNYQKALFMEDYYLWIRMMLNGSKFYNIQEPLLKMRTGNGQISRRAGLKYAINEFKMQKKVYDLGFLNIFEFIRNIVLRFVVRLLPKSILQELYVFLRKNK